MKHLTIPALMLVAAASLGAQDRRGFSRRPAEAIDINLPYNGQFEFARIQYASSRGMFAREPMWAHDYPRAEINFAKILAEVSTVRARQRGSAIFGLADPALFDHSIAYIVEVGYWVPNESEVTALRKWLQRGGFLIVDDFQGQDWMNFQAQFDRVLPDARLQPIPKTHPVFDSFYHITSFEGVLHPYSGAPTQFYGVFEDNDPTKRLMVIANYDGDIAEYWEYSDQGFFPMTISNQAYKLGINYMIYALTR
jgi:hypothetical protein